MGTTYMRVIPAGHRPFTRGLPRAGLDAAPRTTRPGDSGTARQRHRIVITRPVIISANPMAKFQLPRSEMTGIEAPHR